MAMIEVTSPNGARGASRAERATGTEDLQVMLRCVSEPRTAALRESSRKRVVLLE